jgi:glycine oxidase
VLCRGAHAILGSTMEHVGFDPRVTELARDAILGGARRLLPQLGHVERQWAGLRPVTPDGLPIIGPDPEIDGLWYATGHSRNGILLTPLTGEAIADLLATGHTGVDLTRLAVDRFAALPTPAALASRP